MGYIETMKRIRAAVGNGYFCLFLFLGILELIVNIPYYIIKGIMFPIWWLYENWLDGRDMLIGIGLISGVKKFSRELNRRIRVYKNEHDKPIVFQADVQGAFIKNEKENNNGN